MGKEVLLAICVSLLLLVLTGLVSSVSYVNITCRIGTLTGFITNVNFNGTRRVLTEFLGVPYGESTDGARRFAKPIPKAPFDSVYNATFFRPDCPQLFVPGISPSEVSEDCLILNIFVPTDMFNSTRKYPVMIWIYGGGFYSGASSKYIPDTLSTFGDVIVVTVNYRLHAFGFLSTWDDASPGNYGLWDQRLAIQWVHDNIEYFGGNSSSVTLFGESAGAASVLYQALFPGNRGMFHRVIAESGSTFAHWAYSVIPKARKIGSHVRIGCNQSNSDQLIACLRQANVTDLIAAVNDVTLIAPEDFLPRVDGDFLKASTENLLNNHSSEEFQFFSSLDFLSGVNSKEGYLDINSIWKYVFGIQNSIEWPVTTAQFQYYKTYLLNLLYRENPIPMSLATAIEYEYTDWNDPENTSKIRDLLIDFISDTNYFFPAVVVADSHAQYNQSGSTFLYLFTAPTSLYSRQYWMTEADHGDEINYVFGFTKSMLNTYNATDAEVLLSSRIMNWWTNFAKTGNPNAPMHTNEWPQYTYPMREYIKIGIDSSVPSDRFNEPRTAFWLKLIPDILADDLNRSATTVPPPTTWSPPTTAPGEEEGVFLPRFNVDGVMAENVIIILFVAVGMLLMLIILMCAFMLLRQNTTSYKLNDST